MRNRATNVVSTRRDFLLSATAALAAGTAASSGAWGQASSPMPAGPFTVVIPTAVGGQADVIARLIGNKMSDILGRPLVIEPKPGAGGLFSGQYVARAAPTGSTLLFVTGAHSILPGIHRATIKFDAVKDFEFISTISTVPFIVSVAPNHPAKTFQDLIAISKKEPGKISYSTVGAGSTHHLIGELVQRTFGVKWIHVPYKGGATGLIDVSTGRVSVAIDTPVSSLPLLGSGKLRPLAVSQNPRMKQLPDVPTFPEISPGLSVGSYLGLAAPAGTPRPVIDTLNKAMTEAVRDPDIQKKLSALGNNPQASTPDEFGKRVASDVARWTKLTADLKL
jgi:tripartite-type tricarboxylate transporter receptor subunit TctC